MRAEQSLLQAFVVLTVFARSRLCKINTRCRVLETFNTSHASSNGPLCKASRKSWGALLGACGAACRVTGSSVSSAKLQHKISYTQQDNSPLIYIRNRVWEISGVG